MAGICFIHYFLSYIESEYLVWYMFVSEDKHFMKAHSLHAVCIQQAYH